MLSRDSCRTRRRTELTARVSSVLSRACSATKLTVDISQFRLRRVRPAAVPASRERGPTRGTRILLWARRSRSMCASGSHNRAPGPAGHARQLPLHINDGEHEWFCRSKAKSDEQSFGCKAGIRGDSQSPGQELPDLPSAVRQGELGLQHEVVYCYIRRSMPFKATQKLGSRALPDRLRATAPGRAHCKTRAQHDSDSSRFRSVVEDQR